MSICLIAQTYAAAGQTPDNPAIFLRGGYDIAFHGEGYGAFGGPAECASLNNVAGGGLTGVIGIDFPLFSHSFLGIGVGLTDLSGKSDANSVFNARDTSSGEVLPVTLKTALETKMRYLALRSEINYAIADKLLGGPLRLNIGASVLLPLKPTYLQTESITSPVSAAFIADGSRRQSRTISAGDIKTAQSLFVVTAGLENMIQLSSSLFFTQRAGADILLNSAVSDANWSIVAARGELGFRYAFLSSPPPHIEPPPPPEQLSPALSITIKKADVKGKEGRELIASQPTVNAVFFRHNSAVIPEKYKREPLGGAVFADPLEFHRYIIPFIAKLLQDNPRGKIEIYGATSGDDEPGGVELARNRALAVREAFVALGVSPDRIIAAADIFPSVKSSQDMPEGSEENRRADIIVRNARLQDYVSKHNYADISGTANFEVIVKDAGSDSSIILSSNCFAEPMTVSGSGIYSAKLKCRAAGNAGYYSLQIEAKNRTMTANDFTLLPLGNIEKTGEDVQIDRFDALLRFDYNSDELSAENKELLRQMLEKIPAGTVITVYGGADALGSQQRNVQLEKKRAVVTEQFIRSIAGNSFIVRAAPGVDKFPENTPEGRFLNRNLRIRLSKN